MAGYRTFDWFEDEIARDDREPGYLTPELRAKYDAEADRILDAKNKAKERIEQEKSNKLEEIRAKLRNGDESVIDSVGIPEFGDDYELRYEGNNYVVYSEVALNGQENRHVHTTEKEAISHYRKLIWDRLYTKYVRSGEVESLNSIA